MTRVQRSGLGVVMGVVFVVCACAVMGMASANIGLSSRFPADPPVRWRDTMFVLSGELIPVSNMSLQASVGLFPDAFPGVYRGDFTLTVKAWNGPIGIHAGGGFTTQWDWQGSVWDWTPYLHMVAGAQVWIVDRFALFADVRSLDPLPLTWTLDPEVEFGIRVAAAGGSRPPGSCYDGLALWTILALGVIALLAYYPDG